MGIFFTNESYFGTFVHFQRILDYILRRSRKSVISHFHADLFLRTFHKSLEIRLKIVGWNNFLYSFFFQNIKFWNIRADKF